MDGVGALKRLAEDQVPGVSDAKKMKMADNSQPSRVLHVRSLPASTTEFDIQSLVSAFGQVTGVMLMRQRGQALVELESEAAAVQCCNFYKTTQAAIRENPVQIQHSRHAELTMAHNPASASGEGPTVLHIIVENMVYQVTLDVLHTIFSKYDSVLRIITFTKNGQFQALIEMTDSAKAAQAKLTLDGQNIYDRCCTMKIDFSKMATLTITSNNDRQRDYTKPDQAEGVTTVRPMMLGGTPTPTAAQVTASSLASIPGMPAHSVSALQSIMAGGAAGLGGLSPANLSTLTGLVGGGVPSASPVVLVSNLNEELVTPKDLFMLFGVYGDVQRVKILFNKKDTALIQFASGQQAQTAHRHLHRVSFQGKVMHVTNSKHMNVAMPKDSQDAHLTQDYTDSVLHRYKQPGSHNLQNIYAPSATLHISNVPATLSEEDIGQLVLSAAQCAPVAFKWLPSQRQDAEQRVDRKMALVQLPSTEQSIQTLVTLHNYKVGDKRYLRVAFAKNPTVQ